MRLLFNNAFANQNVCPNLAAVIRLVCLFVNSYFDAFGLNLSLKTVMQYHHYYKLNYCQYFVFTAYCTAPLSP